MPITLETHGELLWWWLHWKTVYKELFFILVEILYMHSGQGMPYIVPSQNHITYAIMMLVVLYIHAPTTRKGQEDLIFIEGSHQLFHCSDIGHPDSPVGKTVCFMTVARIRVALYSSMRAKISSGEKHQYKTL